MQHFAIVFYPKENLQAVELFRQKYDPMVTILPPHITMVFPFDYISEELIAQHAAKVAHETPAFHITLHGLFTSFDKYLFLLVDQGKELVVTLHNQLYSHTLSQFFNKDIPFIPHMTIGFFMQNNNFNEPLYLEAKEEAEETNFSYVVSFDSFSLIQGDGITPAKTLQTFFLQQ